MVCEHTPVTRADLELVRCHCLGVRVCGFISTVLLADLAPFYIEIDYIGTWTDARKAVFQAAAARYEAAPSRF